MTLYNIAKSIRRKWFPRNDHDLSLYKFRRIKIHKGDVAIDCGANIGKYTLLLAKKGAIVYSFEPNPYAFGVLSYRTKNLESVICYNAAVLDVEGRMRLYLHNGSKEEPLRWSTSSALLNISYDIDPSSGFEVDVVDLIAFLGKLNRRVRILKMDIEGSEVPILKALITTGAYKQIDYVFVETHDNWFPELRTEMDAIRAEIEHRGISNIDLNWI